MCRMDVSVPEKKPTHLTHEMKGTEVLVTDYQRAHEAKHRSWVIMFSQHLH